MSRHDAPDLAKAQRTEGAPPAAGGDRRWRTAALATSGVAAACVALSVAVRAGPGMASVLTPTEASVVVAGCELRPGARAAAVEAELTRLSEGARGRVVRFDPGDGRPPVEVDAASLGAVVAVDALTDEIASLLRPSTLWDRLATGVAPRVARLELPLLLRVPRTADGAVLEALRERVDRAPRPPRLDLATGRLEAGSEGRHLDADATLAAAERALRASTEGPVLVRPVVVHSPPGTLSEAAARALDVSQVVASFSTRFGRHGDQRDRARNIEIAAARLDGSVLAPGAVVSFNRAVGARTEDNGFRKSWEIFKGEMVEGTGGGTCQVASTLHAAALIGGLEIVERAGHSRPSAYIAMGLDATVVYPAVDLKLRNRFDFPLVVHARVRDGELTVELLGASRPAARVRFERRVEETLDFERRIVESESVPHGRIVLREHGLAGYRIVTRRSIQLGDGTTREERAPDFYPPTARVLEVPPGFDVSVLPTHEATRSVEALRDELGRLGLELTTARGTHPPTRRQSEPEATLTLVR